MNKRLTSWWTRISISIGSVLLGLLAGSYFITQPVIVSRPHFDPPAVDQSRLRIHVKALTEDFMPRDWEHPQNLDRAAAYIHAELSTAGANVTYQTYEMDGNSYRNVIGRFGPKSEETIIVGAHYDAAEEFPGADDNASAVAGLLELARLLGTGPPPVRVELVAYTLEEPKEPGEPGLFRTPFGGSAKHVQSLVKDDAIISVALVMDMIGYFNDKDGSQDLPLGILKPFYPSSGNFIAVVGKIGQGGVVRKVKAAMRSASPLPVYSLSGPALIEGVDWSDHFNYWNAGYPAVLITDTSFYRNKQYHTAGDTADQLDYERMAMVVKGVYAAVFAFTEGVE